MDSLTSQLGTLSLQTSNIAYLIGKKGNNACYFLPSSDKILVSRCVSISDTFEVGMLYNIKRNSPGSVSFSRMIEEYLQSFVDRGRWSFSPAGYDEWILPGLLLGSRLRDYDQTCATVIQRSPLILTMPPRPIYIKRASFRAETGEIVDVIVDNVNRDSDKSMRLFCDPLEPLPIGVIKGSHLQFNSDNERLPIVTKALFDFYQGNLTIVNRSLLDCIYGKSGRFAYSRVDERLITVKMQRGGDVTLNAEQSEAVRRYLSSCPSFAVESPPGTGKTMTAAAMAVSYSGPGLQLFLSTANVPVFNLAIAIAGVKYGNRKIIHLISADREAAQSEAERSPFSIFEVDDEDNESLALFKELGEDLQSASKSKARRLKMKMRRAHADALAGVDGGYDIILATVDMILGKLLKPKNKKHPCRIQAQLETDVRRIVIDEASQLTEAALNAIILCFPQAQIVLIGDSKQLPAFKYVESDIVSEMAAHSALSVIKRKKNLPVITMRLTYRQSSSQMRHYSDVFYSGQLQSGKPEQRRVLSSILKTAKDCVFVRVNESKTLFSGTSLINDAEISALDHLISRLRLGGHDHNSVMVIAYYEAQRKLAEATLPEGYEVLTVDSAQGREKDIVIVLTTRDSPTTTDFFTSPLRCNVAVSRHKKALIILGHESLQKSEPWKQLLQKEYFSMCSFASQ